MSIVRRLPIALALVLVSAPAWPQFHPEEVRAARSDPGQYTLDEASIRIEKIGPTANPSAVAPPALPGEGDSALPELDAIVNLGLKVWKIVVDNKPVVDVKTEYATGLPRGSTGWTDIAGWNPPAGTIYEMSAKNAYGVKMIDVRYQVLRTYGGSCQGKGKYLTAVTVEPLLVEVGWGYRFSMEASVPDTSVVNVGTSQDPVAGMMASLTWRISTPVKVSQGQGLYFLQGDGAYKEIGGPFSGPSLENARARTAAAGRKTPVFD